MKTDLNQEPVFLTDKNRIVVLEALCGKLFDLNMQLLTHRSI